MDKDMDKLINGIKDMSTTSLEIFIKAVEKTDILYHKDRFDIIKKEVEYRKKNPDGRKKVVVYFEDGKLEFRGYKYETDKGFISMYKNDNPVKITRQYYPLKNNPIDIIYEGK